MPVVLIISIVVILAVVVFVAIGRGGQMPEERTDFAPLDLGPVTATDVVLLRPPMAMWGYNMQVTDDAMEQIAESIRERDVRIVALEQLVTDLSREHAPPPTASPYVGTRRRTLLDEAGAARPADDASGASDTPDTPEASSVPDSPDVPGVPGAPAGPGTPGTPGGAPPERSHD